MKPAARTRFSSLFFVFLLAALLSAPSAFGQPAGTDIVIGKTITFPSKVFNTDMISTASPTSSMGWGPCSSFPGT